MSDAEDARYVQHGQYARPLMKGARLQARLRRLEREIAQQRETIAQLTKQQFESEALFRSLANTFPVLVWMADTQGACTYFNQPWLDFTGRQLAQELGHGWAEGIHPDDSEAVYSVYMNAVAARRPFEFEYRLRQADGQFRWVLDRGAPRFSLEGEFLGYIGSAIDIHQLKSTEAELAGTVWELNNLMETLPDIMLTSDLEHRLLKWNRRLEVVSGYSVPELNSLPFLAMIHAADRPLVAQAMQFCLQHDRAEIDGRLACKDGSQRPYHWVGAALRNQQGAIVGLTLVGHDVSERQRVEEELRRANQRLQELDQLKSGFMNAVSHELRTPLATIRGFAEFLEDQVGGELSLEQQAFVEHIQEAAQHLQGMVDDLLDFTQLNAGKLALVQQELELTPTICEAAATMAVQVREKRLDLRVLLPDAALVVWADAGRIRQVLLNLLSNAVKFTPSGGSIRLKAELLGEEVRVTIQDTGIGIPPEHMAHIFQKFYQVDTSNTRATGGAGLGLSLSKALIEAHGGHMGVESCLGEGSTFWFTLPLSSPAQKPTGAHSELRITLMREQGYSRAEQE